MSAPNTFSRYQTFVVAVLAFLQFTIVLDFMMLSPLGALLMPALLVSSSMGAYAPWSRICSCIPIAAHCTTCFTRWHSHATCKGLPLLDC
jgi:hypothetical protein